MLFSIALGVYACVDYALDRERPVGRMPIAWIVVGLILSKGCVVVTAGMLARRGPRIGLLIIPYSAASNVSNVDRHGGCWRDHCGVIRRGSFELSHLGIDPGTSGMEE